MAVLMRLSEEDRATYPGGDQDGWVRFDEHELDDQDFDTLNDYESQFGTSIEFLLRVDKVAQTARWTAVRVWLARKMAGIDTPPWSTFNIKVRKVEIKQEEPEAAADADPPGSSPSSEVEASGTGSA